jgi:hypothetical protein
MPHRKPPAPSAAHSIVTPLPNSAGGLSLDPLAENPPLQKVSAAALQLINDIAGENNSAVNYHTWAVYQGSTDPVVGGPALIEFIGGTLSSRITQPLLFAMDVEDAGTGAPTPQEISPGPGGGAASCEPSQQNISYTSCIWVDNSTFGMIIPESASNWPVAAAASVLQTMRPALETGITK